MAYKKIEGTDMEKSKTWKFQESKDKEFEGVYLGKKENLGENQSTLYEFEYIGSGKEFAQHEKVGVWGSKILDDRLGTLIPGEKVRITYEGKVKGKKNTFHAFTVEHDVPEAGDPSF